uniref:MAK10-like protein n=1 Tax=Tanacetum cinerariifolium TaxID=118510 RepID=A0A6L2LW95_TANCI|nr:MAK10-like protein [Tanacetum cinerariifolium]
MAMNFSSKSKSFMTMSIPSQDEPLTNQPNDPKDFTKPVKAISFPKDVSSTSDSHLIELGKQVQYLMEAHLAPMKPTQVNKMTTLCEICSGPHDTQYCMEDPEQASVEYTIFENLDDTPLYNTAGGLTTQMNFTSTDYHSKEELQSKGIKIPSKLLSPKYLSQLALGKKVVLSPAKLSIQIAKMKLMKKLKAKRKSRRKLKKKDDDLKHFDTFPTMKELSVIDHYLGTVVFGKPFMEATRLVYNKEEGTVVFKRDKEMIIFKMLHKMDMFKHVDFTDRGTDSIPPFIIESDDDNCEKITTQIA